MYGTSMFVQNFLLQPEVAFSYVKVYSLWTEESRVSILRSSSTQRHRCIVIGVVRVLSSWRKRKIKEKKSPSPRDGEISREHSISRCITPGSNCSSCVPAIAGYFEASDASQLHYLIYFGHAANFSNLLLPPSPPSPTKIRGLFSDG